MQCEANACKNQCLWLCVCITAGPRGARACHPVDATLPMMAADPTNDKSDFVESPAPRAFGECEGDAVGRLAGKFVVVVVATGEIMAVEITVGLPLTVVVMADLTVVELGKGSIAASPPHTALSCNNDAG